MEELTDLEKYKQLFLSTNLNFTGSGTVIGVHVITIYPDNQREVQFEFDNQGKFLRVI